MGDRDLRPNLDGCDAAARDVVDRMVSGGYSRRRFLRFATGATALAMAGPAFLAACGSSTKGATSTATAAAAAATSAATAGAASATAAAATPHRGGTLTFALATEPSIGGLDPNISPAAVAHRVMQNIYDTLVVEKHDFTFAPSLATSWEPAPDGLSWTFKLRTDVKFQDGTPFNAEAVKFNLDRIKDPKTGSYFATTLLGPVKDTQVIDDSTVKANFTAPHAPLLDSLSAAFLGMDSPTAVQKLGKDFANNPVGTGPYKFKEWVKQDHIALTANTDYAWGPKIYKHSDAPYFNDLTFRIIPEASTRLGALQSGEIDLAESILPADLAGLKSNSATFASYAVSPGDPYVLFMNTSKAPFSDERVRKAMLYALDRAGIVKALYLGIYPLAEGPLASTTFGFDKSVVGMYKQDVAQANQLLDAAGWTKGSGGIRAKNGQPLQVTLLGSDVDREQRHAVSEAIQLQGKQVGIDVKILRQPIAQYIKTRNDNGYDMVGTSFVSSDPDIMRLLYYSKSTANLGNLKSPELDKLLLKGAETISAQDRVPIYAQAQKYVMDNALILPIYEFPYYVGGRTGVEDLEFDVRAYPVLYDVYKKTS